MSDHTDKYRERKLELERNIHDMNSYITTLENRVVGLENILDLRIGNIYEQMSSRKEDRDEMLDRIISLEKKVSNISIDVAKLIGKWSVITILIAGLVSAFLSGRINSVEVLPEALPPKVEQKLNGNSHVLPFPLD